MSTNNVEDDDDDAETQASHPPFRVRDSDELIKGRAKAQIWREQNFPLQTDTRTIPRSRNWAWIFHALHSAGALLHSGAPCLSLIGVSV
jgi:hypothetical protein